MGKNRIFWGVVLIGFIGVGIYGVDRHNKLVKGYCFAQKRYLSDQEIKDAGIATVIDVINKRYATLPPEKRGHYPNLPYTNVETYYKLNPNSRISVNPLYLRPKRSRGIMRKLYGRKMAYMVYIYPDAKRHMEELLFTKPSSFIRLSFTACGQRSYGEDGL